MVNCVRKTLWLVLYALLAAGCAEESEPAEGASAQTDESGEEASGEDEFGEAAESTSEGDDPESEESRDEQIETGGDVSDSDGGEDNKDISGEAGGGSTGESKCDDGEIENCKGLCSPAHWLGDDFCNHQFDCGQFDFDGGDCNGDETDEEGGETPPQSDAPKEVDCPIEDAPENCEPTSFFPSCETSTCPPIDKYPNNPDSPEAIAAVECALSALATNSPRYLIVTSNECYGWLDSHIQSGYPSRLARRQDIYRCDLEPDIIKDPLELCKLKPASFFEDCLAAGEYWVSGDGIEPGPCLSWFEACSFADVKLCPSDPDSNTESGEEQNDENEEESVCNVNALARPVRL